MLSIKKKQWTQQWECVTSAVKEVGQKDTTVAGIQIKWCDLKVLVEKQKS